MSAAALPRRLGALFARFRIAIKILVAPTITGLMMIGLWLISTLGLQNQAEDMNRLVDNSLRGVIRANSVYQDAAAIQSDIFRLLVWQDAELAAARIDRLHRETRQRIEAFPKALQGLQRIVAERDPEFADRLAARGQRFHQAARAANALAHRDAPIGSGMVVNAANAYDRFRRLLADFQRRVEDRADSQAAAAAQSAETLSRWLAGVVLADMFIAVTITLLVSRHIAQAIGRITTTTSQLAEGNLETPIYGQQRGDEIGAMARALAVLRESEQHRRRLESERIEAEKLASLGSMVAGMAHEINTPIGLCLTAASHLDDRTRSLEERQAEGQLRRRDLTDYLSTARETTDVIVNNVHRASDLIQSFKKIAVDRTSEEKRSFNLCNYVEEVINALHPELKATPHTIERRIPAEIDLVSYPGPFGQVVTNLILNAVFHAFPKGQTGTITVTAESGPGDAITFQIADDGAGIPAETRARIFEPFFTTQRSHGGSGLGLHLVYAIVTTTLGGQIACTSEPGAGTTFTLTLPREANSQADTRMG